MSQPAAPENPNIRVFTQSGSHSAGLLDHAVRPLEYLGVIVTPMSRAVLRFTISSTLSIESSPGLAPFNTLSTYIAMRRIDSAWLVSVTKSGRQLRRPYRMNTRISSAVETSVYVLATAMTPRYGGLILFSVLQGKLRCGGTGAHSERYAIPGQGTVKLILP
jgi:hypothetical protein